MRNAYQIFVMISEEKRPLGRLGPAREVKIEVDFIGIGCGSVGWIHLAEDRV
jgi:hypothetical protein